MAHFAKKLISVIASMGVLALSPMALAQETVDPLEGLGPSEDNTGDLFNDSGSIFDLVHRAVLTNPVSAAEQRERQHRNINNAAAEFLQQRQETLSESGPIYAPVVVTGESEAVSGESETE